MSVKKTENGCLIGFHIVPGSSINEVSGMYGDDIKIKLKAPPVDGKANLLLVEYLSDLTGLKKNDVVIKSGLSGRSKRIFFNGCSQADIKIKLGIVK